MEKIKEGIYWVGSDNPEGRNFHGISTPRGGSYNSYFIEDQKSVLIDGANRPFIDKYLMEIDGAQIQYLVVNHTEPDHTGAINTIIEKTGATIVCTAKAKEFLESMGINAEFRLVEDGEELNIGKRTLQFLKCPMVHWPETMMTYVPEDKILFSGDLYGTEIAHEALFADEYNDFSKLTRDYFAIVMRPVNATVKKAIEKSRELEIQYIAPSHGPVHRDKRIMEYYEKLCNKPEENKVAIFYASIWYGTKGMAEEIAKGVRDTGAEAKIFDINSSNFIEMMAEAMTAKSVCIGSLTILGGYHPVFDGLFPFFKLNRQEKDVVVFGTHGWVPSAVPKLEKKAEELGWKVADSVDFRFGIGEDARLFQIGKNLGGG